MTNKLGTPYHLLEPCKKCSCPSCQNGYDNHEHYCTKGEYCIEKVK